jgi:Family of unknown function (DUF6292)
MRSSRDEYWRYRRPLVRMQFIFSRRGQNLDRNITPDRHPDPWVNLLCGYMTEAVQALAAGGVQVQRSWLDPEGPRDATIVLAGSKALVFDEVTGWRYGRFVSGRQGVRTTLSDISYVGGGVLLDGRELTHKILSGHSAPRQEFRSAADLRDGLDDALREVL